MRLYCIIDEKSKGYLSVLGCLGGLSKQFEGIVPVTFTFDVRDLSTLPWEAYDPKSKGVAFSKVSADTKEIWEKHGYLYDSVVYFIDEANWKANDLRGPDEPQIKGWNLGQFFNNYQVQLLATNEVVANMNYRINEEVAHSIDDFAYRELGRNIDSELGLDYDEDIVHDRNNPAGERGNYREFYVAHTTLIQDIVKRRMEKKIQSLLQLILTILRTHLMRLNRPKPTWDYHNN